VNEKAIWGAGRFSVAEMLGITNHSSIKGSSFSNSSIFMRNSLVASSKSLDNRISLFSDDVWAFSGDDRAFLRVDSGIILPLKGEMNTINAGKSQQQG
jgi:hypothetical protein